MALILLSIFLCAGRTTKAAEPAKEAPVLVKKILVTVPSHFPAIKTNPKTGKTWTIVGIMTDGFNFNQAKAGAADAIVKYPDLKAMVGLWAYNPPRIIPSPSAGAGTCR